MSSSQYFPSYTESEIIKVDLDLSNYVTQADLRNLQVKTSDFALKTNLGSLKTEVGKFDVDKLVPVPNALAKLSKEVQEDLKKKKQTDFNDLKQK